MASRRHDVLPYYLASRRKCAPSPCHLVVNFTCGMRCPYYAGPCNEKNSYLVHQKECKWYTCVGTMHEDGTMCVPGAQISWHCQGCEREEELDHLESRLTRLDTEWRSINGQIDKIPNPRSLTRKYYEEQRESVDAEIMEIEERIHQLHNYLEYATKAAQEYKEQSEMQQA